MPLLVKIFPLLGTLLAVQSIVALRQGYKFLAYARHSWQRTLSDYKPSLTVIIPVKAWEADYELNTLAFLDQDYPRYQVIFTLASVDDPAYAQLQRIAAQPRATPESATISVVIGPRSLQRGD